MIKYVLLLSLLAFATPASVEVEQIKGQSVTVRIYRSLQRVVIKLKDIPCKVEEGDWILIEEYGSDKIKVVCPWEEEPEGC
tara:strand:- start:128 stop:370 length:243 start_codon:yes stop_codon:yes gene_type:complete